MNLIEVEKGVFKYAADDANSSWITLYKLNEMSDEQLHKYGLAKLKKKKAEGQTGNEK